MGSSKKRQSGQSEKGAKEEIVRIGVVSATGTGRKRILPALLGSDTCKVTAVHGRDEDKVRRLGKDFNLRHTYTELEQMISEAEFDIAVVCSPPFLHKEQLEVLVRAGVPSLCEKPLALSEKEATAIKKMVEKSSTPVMVAHQLRHQNTYAEIKQALEGGEIGEVESASFEWNYLLDREDPQNAWKLDPALNGPTCLSDAGVHCVDLAIDLFGPGSIWGAMARGGENEGVIEDCDMLAVHSGVRVSYTVSRLSRTVGNKLFISGTLGEIVAHHFFTDSSAPSVKITVDGQDRIVEKAAGNPYRQVIEDFARAASDSDFVSVGTTLDEAVSACRMIDEAYEALGSPTGEWEPGSYQDSGSDPDSSGEPDSGSDPDSGDDQSSHD